MEFITGTRVGLVTGTIAIVAGTVLDNDGDGTVTVRLDSGEVGTVTPGDLYPLTDHDLATLAR